MRCYPVENTKTSLNLITMKLLAVAAFLIVTALETKVSMRKTYSVIFRFVQMQVDDKCRLSNIISLQ